MTERGRIACDTVVLAGGAWSRLFCGNHGIRLPQLKVLSSVMRTERFGRAGDLGERFGFGFRKRLDGGYNVAGWSGNVLESARHDAFLLPDFLPTLRQQWRNHAAAHRGQVHRGMAGAAQLVDG